MSYCIKRMVLTFTCLICKQDHFLCNFFLNKIPFVFQTLSALLPFGPVPLTLDPVGAIIIGYRIIVPAVNYLLISVCPNKKKSKKSRFSLLFQTQRPVCYTIRLSRGP